jgi:methanethiol S-methyltransferase
MSRILSCLYGVVAYTIFLGAFLHAIAFVAGIPVPRTLDAGGPTSPVTEAIVINVLLMSLFAIQHSVMARAGF